MCAVYEVGYESKKNEFFVAYQLFIYAPVCLLFLRYQIDPQ